MALKPIYQFYRGFVITSLKYGKYSFKFLWEEELAFGYKPANLI